MLSIKNFVTDVRSVSPAWCYEYYCGLREKLQGQDIKIKSIFKEDGEDKTPSLCIYNDNGIYKFKCFSTSYSGNHIELVKRKYHLDFISASAKIVGDYNLHGASTSTEPVSFVPRDKYKVTAFKIRQWSVKDKEYWVPYNIGTSLLNEYHVEPLAWYQMSKTEDSQIRTLDFKSDYFYGYFKPDGTLYKIYQPKVTDRKFIKIIDYIQGSDQLQGHPFLMYCSSLKDIMAMRSLNLRMDYKAPDSENTLLTKDIVEADKKKYQKIIVLLDSDAAGIKAMKRYREIYGLPFVYFRYAKDPSDGNKLMGPRRTKSLLIPMIDKKLNEAA